MRKSILLPLLLVGCGPDAPDAAFRVIPDFLDRSAAVSCPPVDVRGVAPEIIRRASDSTIVVLDAAQLRLTELGQDLTPVWTLDYLDHGPAAIDRPVDMVLLGDTAVAVASQGDLRLVILARDGELIRTVPLDFIPHALAVAPNGDILVSMMPYGSLHPTLVFRYRNGELAAVPVPLRLYPDMTVQALGNMTRIASLADGSALVVHQHLAPRAFRIVGDSAVVLDVPTPDATAANIDFVPRPPVRREQMDRILSSAAALSADPTRGRVFLLTRSGREVDGKLERAIIEVDDTLGYVASYTLDVHAVAMAYNPLLEAAVVVDDVDRFYLCPLHATDTD